MHSQKVVTPVKTGVQSDVNYMILLDSGFRRNDGIPEVLTFYETIKVEISKLKVVRKTTI